MKKRVLGYLDYLENTKPESQSDGDLESFRRDLLIQIGFFQHERFIHLVVTVTFAVIAFITLGIALTGLMQAYILLGLIFVLLVPYIKHYYLLENSVQKMYKYYDALVAEENRRRHESEKN